MKPILTTREALALCSYDRARRTDPTPQQTERARREWSVAKLSQWIAGRLQPPTAR